MGAAAPLPAATPAPARLPRTCGNCQVPMQKTGELAFRVGGYVGASGMFPGDFNQLAEGLQPFAVYYCQRCGKVDLYYPGT